MHNLRPVHVRNRIGSYFACSGYASLCGFPSNLHSAIPSAPNSFPCRSYRMPFSQSSTRANVKHAPPFLRGVAFKRGRKLLCNRPQTESSKGIPTSQLPTAAALEKARAIQAGHSSSRNMDARSNERNKKQLTAETTNNKNSKAAEWKSLIESTLGWFLMKVRVRRSLKADMLFCATRKIVFVWKTAYRRVVGWTQSRFALNGEFVLCMLP